MTTVRDAYYEFLVSHAPRPANVPEAMERIDPFFAQAAADQYALVAADDLDLAEAAEAIRAAAKLEVTRVIPVSLASPLPRAPWLAARHYDAVVADMLLCSVRETVPRRIGERAEAAKDALGIPFWRGFLAHLGDGLMTSLENTVPESLKVPLALTHGMALWHLLFLYLAAASTADAATMRELGPLVTMSAKAFLLGEKRDEPGVWLVLVA